MTFAVPGVRGDIRTNLLVVNDKGIEHLFLNNSVIWMSLRDVWSDAGQINVYSEFRVLNPNGDTYVDCFYKTSSSDFARSNYDTCDIYACSGDTIQVSVNNDLNDFPSYFVGEKSVKEGNPYMRLVDSGVEVTSGGEYGLYYDVDDQRQGCTVYHVYMEDTFGDGWNGAMLYFTDTIAVTLMSGSYGDATVCLPPGSYSPYACGGFYPSEVGWSLPAYGLSGGAASSCSAAEALETFTVAKDVVKSTQSCRYLSLELGCYGDSGCAGLPVITAPSSNHSSYYVGWKTLMGLEYGDQVAEVQLGGAYAYSAFFQMFDAYEFERVFASAIGRYSGRSYLDWWGTVEDSAVRENMLLLGKFTGEVGFHLLENGEEGDVSMRSILYGEGAKEVLSTDNLMKWESNSLQWGDSGDIFGRSRFKMDESLYSMFWDGDVKLVYGNQLYDVEAVARYSDGGELAYMNGTGAYEVLSGTHWSVWRTPLNAIEKYRNLNTLFL